MGEGVLQRVHGLTQADPEERERCAHAAAQRERHVDVDAVIGIWHPVGVQTVEGLDELAADEALAGGERALAAAGLVVLGVAQAVLLLVLRVAVDGRELADVGGTVPVEIVVTDADDDRRRCDVLHVSIEGEGQVGDQREVVAIGRNRGRVGDLRAKRAECTHRDALVTAGAYGALVGVRRGRFFRDHQERYGK